jgi:two-component system alkaline phosphatase synthesis response regulator PhoP
MGSKILIIEDELHIAEGLKLNLSLQGHDVSMAHNGLEGLNKFQAENPELIILDLMMPGLDGFQVLKKVRAENERVPILILSAKDESRDKVKCLEGGVDDYLSKPFNLDEFLLRVERLLTRSSWSTSEESNELLDLDKQFKEKYFEFGSNKIDFILCKGHSLNSEFNLTSQEIRLLKLFIFKKNIPLTRQELLELGWGYSQDTSTRTVDNFIVRFRKYFEKDPKKPEFFKSMRSVGYIFTPGSK